MFQDSKIRSLQVTIKYYMSRILRLNRKCCNIRFLFPK
jgi:hypothetical protein